MLPVIRRGLVCAKKGLTFLLIDGAQESPGVGTEGRVESEHAFADFFSILSYTLREGARPCLLLHAFQRKFWVIKEVWRLRCLLILTVRIHSTKGSLLVLDVSPSIHLVLRWEPVLLLLLVRVSWIKRHAFSVAWLRLLNQGYPLHLLGFRRWQLLDSNISKTHLITAELLLHIIMLRVVAPNAAPCIAVYWLGWRAKWSMMRWSVHWHRYLVTIVSTSRILLLLLLGRAASIRCLVLIWIRTNHSLWLYLTEILRHSISR